MKCYSLWTILWNCSRVRCLHFEGIVKWIKKLAFEGFSIPDFIHYIYFPILVLEKEPVFSFLMLSAKQGHYWYHFYKFFGMTRSLTGDWTTRLSRRRCKVPDRRLTSTTYLKFHHGFLHAFYIKYHTDKIFHRLGQFRERVSRTDVPYFTFIILKCMAQLSEYKRAH